jgi:hypothetical protein
MKSMIWGKVLPARNLQQFKTHNEQTIKHSIATGKFFTLQICLIFYKIIRAGICINVQSVWFFNMWIAESDQQVLGFPV